jgi:hypothetical protein
MPTFDKLHPVVTIPIIPRLELHAHDHKLAADTDSPPPAKWSLHVKTSQYGLSSPKRTVVLHGLATSNMLRGYQYAVAYLCFARVETRPSREQGVFPTLVSGNTGWR